MLNEDINIIHLNKVLPKLNSCYCYIDNSIDRNSLYIFDISNIYLSKNQKINNYYFNQFIISKIYTELINKKNYIIIKGNLVDDLKINISNVNLKFLSPNKYCQCSINSTSKNIQAYIYCQINKINNSKLKEILIINQILYSINDNYNLILINEETLFQNYKIIKSIKKENLIIKNTIKWNKYFFLFIYYINIKSIFLFIFILIKIFKKIYNKQT